MTEWTIFIILAPIVLLTILFTKLKPWWKYLNLSLFVLYISFTSYWIYSDEIMGGWVAILNGILLMLIQLGILFISIIFFYKIFVREKEWR